MVIPVGGQQMPRLMGCDPTARDASTADDLCAPLMRGVVDIYHHTPHAGLGGETPGNCWIRLTESVAPATASLCR